MYRTLVFSLIISLLIGCAVQAPVPKTTEVILRVPVAFTQESMPAWNQIARQIKYSNANHIVIYWQGRGGLNYIADNLAASIEAAQTRGIKVDFIVTGESDSNHANVTCYANKRELHSILVFHPTFNTVHGNKIYAPRYEQLDVFSKCLRVGVLTVNDVNRMINQKLRLEINRYGAKTFKPDWGKF